MTQKLTSLFDGKTLSGWKLTNFGGESEVVVKDGVLVFQPGYPMTGLTYEKEFPKINYEISLEAQRAEGNDFFCGLTFPIGENHCSLILGGWGGSVTGLSTINGAAANENGTTKYISYKAGKWYKIRLRVTEAKVEAWIDDKQVVDQKSKEVEYGILISVARSKPLGLCAFETKSLVRNFGYKSLEK